MVLSIQVSSLRTRASETAPGTRMVLNGPDRSRWFPVWVLLLLSDRSYRLLPSGRPRGLSPDLVALAPLSVSLLVLLQITYPNRLAGTGIILFSTVFSEFSGVLDESKGFFSPFLSSNVLKVSLSSAALLFAMYFADGGNFPYLVAWPDVRISYMENRFVSICLRWMLHHCLTWYVLGNTVSFRCFISL